MAYLLGHIHFIVTLARLFETKKQVICMGEVNTIDASHHKMERKSPDEVLRCPVTVIKAQIASSINWNVTLSLSLIVLFCFMYHFFMATITMEM